MSKLIKRIISFMLVFTMIFTMIKLSDAKASTVYKLGETWIVDGQWKLTFNSVTTTTERNEFSDKTPQQVVIINYTYENIGYVDSIMDGLYIGTPEFTVYDENDEVGYTYPDSITTYPQEITPGHKCTNAQICYGLNNKSSVITMEFSGFDGNSIKQSASFSLDVDKIPVSSISLSNTSINLSGLGSNAYLTAAVLPYNATDKTVLWSSSNNRIASVSSTGTVTANGNGTAVITAASGDKSTSCMVAVTGTGIEPVLGISLDKTSLELAIGKTSNLNILFNPAIATNKEINWSSSDASVAVVDNEGNITGTGIGTTAITAATVDGGYTASCIINVTKPVTGIILDKNTATLKIGEVANLTPTVSPVDANNKNVIWSSSNTSIAVVDNSGIITGTGKGTAVITATTSDGAYTASCIVNVIKPVTGITLDKNTATLKMGQYIDIKAAVNPDDADNSNVNWTSSNTSIVLVDNAGRVTPAAPGTATITATTVDGGYTASCVITVVKPVTGLDLSYCAKGLKKGESFNLFAIIKPSDAADKSVTWSSSDTSIATVDNSGNVTAVSLGTAVITALTTDGGYKATCNISVMQEPAAPLNLKAVSAGYDSINITWSAVPGASEYILSRSTSSSGTYYDVIGTQYTSYIDGGNTGTTYYYKVRAYKSDGLARVYGNFSTIAYAKPILPAPTSVKAVSSSYNSINISWKGVTGSFGYDVYRSLYSTGSYTLLKANVDDLCFNNTGLITNRTYYYKVRAYRLVNNVKVYSGFSSIVSARPIPMAPYSVSAASSSYTSVIISWSRIIGASGYAVYRATSPTGTYTLIPSSIYSYKTNYYKIYTYNTRLITNRTYYYKIRAYRLIGTTKVYSNFSSVVSAKPILSVPTNFKLTKLNSTSNKLAWGGVSGANGYEIYRAPYTGIYSYLTRTTYLYYTNKGVAADRTYYYKIRAYRIIGSTKVYSNWTNAQSNLSTTVNTVGNSWSNLNNGGIATYQGEWIYYRSGINNGCIYKMRFDGSEKQLVYNGRSASELSVIGRVIYYRSAPALNIFGLDRDDETVALCYEKNLNYYGLAGNYHYIYAASTNRYYCGYNFAIDGNGYDAGITLFHGDRDYFGVGDTIYYLNFDADNKEKIYKNKFTGGYETLVLNCSVSKFDIYNNYIYYISPLDNKLYRSGIDGSNISLFMEDKTDCINIQDGWIYYSNMDDGNKLYKIKTDGTCNIKLNNEAASYISVIKNWIFYVTGNYCIRIKNDGTCRESL